MPGLGSFVRRSGGPKPTDPQELFNSLTLRGSVQNLWTPQSAALVEWDKHRAEADVSIEMPTGGGKTLVGLLVAQSIANEGKGKVLYVCPNNQLVEQTAAKAREVGLTVATYKQKQWENQDEFLRGVAPCITSYASAFQPFPTPRTENLQALIIDDAHVAVGDLKARFTLTLDSKHPAFATLKSMLQTYAVSVQKGARFDDAIKGDPHALCFLPSFTTSRNAQAIQLLLVKHGVGDDKSETKFVWEYLADRLDRCLFFVADKRIQITAPLPSIDSVRAFSGSQRRVYLTATLPSPYEAARVFGNRITARRITPAGKLGAAQKMIAFIWGDDSRAQRTNATLLVKKHKACIIVPSRADAAKKWAGVQVYGKNDGEAGLDAFRKAPAPSKLVLAGRFDGIDLPGDSCRVLVLDGLPRGSHMVDRFLAESIRSRELRASGTAIKIVQAIGRIFRSNTDHGAVLLVGDDLQRWLMDAYNQGFLPPLLQQQVAMALDFKADVREGKYSFDDLLRGVLNAEADWDAAYNDNLAHYATTHSSFDANVSNAFAMEHVAAKALWDGNFTAAAQRYKEAAETIAAQEPALAGWFLHLSGLALYRTGDEEAANALFLEAAAVRSEFGRPAWNPKASAVGGQAGEQAARITQLLNKPQDFTARINLVLERLTYETPTNQLEEAICDLGKLLGFEADRPDNTRAGPKNVKAGPDIVWIVPWRNQGAWFEAKTGKQKTSQYTKEEIGQCHQHAQWLLTNKPGTTFTQTFIVGHHLGVVPEASPTLELKVLELDELVRIATQLGRLANSALLIPAEQRPLMIQTVLKMDGMLWPNLVDNLDTRFALDLQSSPPPPEGDDD